MVEVASTMWWEEKKNGAGEEIFVGKEGGKKKKCLRTCDWLLKGRDPTDQKKEKKRDGEKG